MTNVCRFPILAVSLFIFSPQLQNIRYSAIQQEKIRPSLQRNFRDLCITPPFARLALKLHKCLRQAQISARSEAIALSSKYFNVFLRLHEVKHKRYIFAFLELEQN